jgi:thiol-disulfide isomerase/thioredoxin
MLFSRLNRREYIKHLISAAIVIFCSVLEANGLFTLNKSAKDIPNPFSSGIGFLPDGQPFEHKIKNENGEEFSVSDLKGNVVIIVLFTTWCSNCPAVLQDMDFLVEKLSRGKINNVKIIALNIGNESIGYLKVYYKGRDIQLLDVYHSLSPKIMAGIVGVPICLIFDKNGSSVCGYLGAENYSSDRFTDYIKQLAQQ